MSSHANLFFSFYKESTTYLYLNRDQIIIFIIPSFWCIVYEFCYLNTTPRRIILTEQRMCATIFYMLFTCTATVIRSKKNTENIWTIDSQQSYIMVPYYYLLKLGRRRIFSVFSSFHVTRIWIWNYIVCIWILFPILFNQINTKPWPQFIRLSSTHCENQNQTQTLYFAFLLFVLIKFYFISFDSHRFRDKNSPLFQL